MELSEVLIVSGITILAFGTGVIVGGICALKCVKFGVRASYEIRNGNQGLSDDSDGVDAELEMIDKIERTNHGGKKPV